MKKNPAKTPEETVQEAKTAEDTAAPSKGGVVANKGSTAIAIFKLVEMSGMSRLETTQEMVKSSNTYTT